MSKTSLLKTLTLGLLVYDKRDLVLVPASTTVDEALGIIQRENVLALPVASTTDPSKFIGILSITDIMAYVAFGSFRIDQSDSSQFQSFMSGEIPVSDLLTMHAESSSVWTLEDTDPIERCLEPMSKGIHRIVVRQSRTHKDGSVKVHYRMLTQSDLVRFLMSYSCYGRSPSDGTADASKSLAELHVYDSPNKPPLTSIPSSCTALEAFRLLEQHELNSLPIINADGSILTSISASDLRGLRSHQLSSILQPVPEFLKSQRGGLIPVPLTATPNSTLYEVSMLLTLNRAHHVWVVDENRKPLGVVSLSDIICKYSPYDYLV
jgi:5'-AMP-activated protein kinase, regulatory gamma subunit